MSTDRPILIVEDDVAVRETLAAHLAVGGGFTTVGAATLEEANANLAAEDKRFDTVLLDVGLPDGNGFDFCVKLRQLGHNMPIIMLTGWDTEADIVRGLQAGASDYIAKPFRSDELLARIRAQLRMFESSDDAVFDIGPYAFRPAAKLLQDRARSRRIRLTGKEAAILKFLYHAGPGPCNAKCCWAKCGATMQRSRRTRWRRISIGCARKWRPTLMLPRCSLPRVAVID